MSSFIHVITLFGFENSCLEYRVTCLPLTDIAIDPADLILHLNIYRVSCSFRLTYNRFSFLVMCYIIHISMLLTFIVYQTTSS